MILAGVCAKREKGGINNGGLAEIDAEKMSDLYEELMLVL